MEMSYIYTLQYTATSHMLLSTSGVASVIREANFKFYLILVNLNFCSHM